MRYEDTSGSVSNSGTPEARDDADALATGSNGPATGNVISGAGTLTGKAGEDTAANGHVVAIRGAGGTDTSDNGQSLHVDGRYGALVIDEHGNYKYVADGRAPADFRDLFQYTLADSKGGRSVADLVITRGAELKVADNAQHIVPGPDGVVTLPAGVDLNDVHVVGRDLVVTLPDGSQIVIVDGAVFVPQLVLGGVEVPSTNLAALLIDAEPKPAAGNPQSSGGNFDVPVPPLDPGVPLGDLIPPTELVFTPPEIKEIGQFVDLHPDAGTVTVQLDDDALPGGNPGGVGDTADNVNSSGFLPGSGGDGALTWDLSDGGAPVGFSYVDGPNGSILVMQGAVQVLTITIDPDTGAYTVTQNAPILHAPGGDENNAAFVINYTVTDADGDAALGTLNINVNDDTPTVTVVAGSDANVNLTTHDAATVGAASEAVSTSANFGGVFSGTSSSPGADGAGAGTTDGYALTTTGGASGLTQHGVAINLYSVGGVIVGSTAASAAGIDASNTVFTVSTTNTGVVTLTQFSQIDHTNTDPSPTGAPFDDHGISLADGAITLTRSETVVDKDGDSVTGSAAVGIGANLHFLDDGPTIHQADHGEPTLVVDETDLGTNATASFAANFSASFGADGPAANSITYALGISAAGANSGLIDTATGQAIVLVQNGAVVEGHVGNAAGALAFTVSVDAAGDVTLDQIRAVVHPDATNPDTDESVTLSADNLVTLTATAHDFDGDTASSTINIGTNLVFHDDGPTAAIGTTGQNVSLDETVGVQGDSNDVAGPLAVFAGVASKGVDPDMATQFAANANAVVNSTGTVFGADGPGTAVFGLNVSSAGVDSGLNTTDGHDILLTLENGIVVGRVSGGADDGKAAFAISIDSSGHISMVEWLSIQHPNTGNPDDSVSIANGAVLATVTATDGDGDTSTASTAIGGLISFQDDGPTAAVGTTGTGVSIDETVGVQGDSNDVAGPLAVFAGVANKGVDPDMVTQFAANSSATVNSTGTLFGSDGAGTAAFSLSVSSAGVDSGLNTTDGHDILLTLENGIVVGRVSGGADDGKAAFAISIDSSGHLSMVEWLSIQHPDTGNPDDSLSIANGAVLATVTATDGDGDTSTASTAIGGLISFQDDGPTISASSEQPNLTVDETTLATNASASFAGVFTSSFGSDGAGAVTYALGISAAGANSGLVDTATGQAIVLVQNGAVVEGHVGNAGGSLAFTVTVDGSGNVTLDQIRAVVHPNVNNPNDSTTLGADNLVTLTATVTDGDGDHQSATANIGTNLVFLDDGPSIILSGSEGALTVDETHLLIDASTSFASAFTPSFGADGAGTVTYALSILSSGANSGLVDTASGQNIVLVMSADGTFVEGHVGNAAGALAFTVTVNASGTVTLDQQRAVVHPNAADPNDNVTLSADNLVQLTATVTDKDGDHSTATLNIGQNLNFHDDGPSANNDSDTITSGGTVATGNVISGVGTNEGAANADAPGADGFGSVTTIHSNGSGLTDTTFSAGVLSVHGTFGTLEIDASGNYTYTRDGGSPGSVSEQFTYTYIDKDGDPATATLTVTINDSAPTLPDPGLVQLDDDALANGNPGGPGGTDDVDSAGTPGQLVGTGGDGALTYDFAGTNTLPAGFTTNLVDASHLQILQGATVVLTITLNNSTGVFSVVQNHAIDHPAGNLENNDLFGVGVQVKDADGDTDPATITINVDDDTPTVVLSGTSPSLTVDETVLATNDTKSFSGMFTDSFGADGPAAANSVAYALGINAGATGLVDVATGQAIVLVSNAGVIEGHVGNAGGALAFTVSVDGSGNVTLDQIRALSHPDANNPNDSVTLANDNLVTLTQTITDHDGDQASATANIGQNLNFLDDGPSISLSGSENNLTVDETTLATNATAAFATAFTSAFGADGAGAVTYALTVTGGNGVASGLIDVATGSSIVLVNNAGVIEGHVGNAAGALAFTVSVSAAGDVTLDQIRAIQHPDANNPNDSVTLSADNLVVLTATVTDKDGDHQSAALNLGQNLNFLDDGPSISASSTQPNLTVDETNLATNATASFSGVFTSSFGADGAGTVTYALGVSAPSANSGLIDVASGSAIVLVMNGNVVEGHVGTAAGLLAFTVSVNAAGDVTLDQIRAVQHPDANNPNDSVTLSADTLVTLTATVTDKDGDHQSATANIGQNLNFLDDGPSISLSGTENTLTVDETNLAINATAAFATAFTPLFGADGAGTVTYALTVTGGNGVASGLIDVATGSAIVLVNNAGVIEGHVATTGGLLAFTVTVDASGNVTLDQVRAVQHPNASDPNDNVTLSADNLVVLTATVTDKDGDHASTALNIGTNLNFHDDGPTISLAAVTEPTLTVDETVLATNATASFAGSFTSAFGADGAGSVTYAVGISAPLANSGLVDTATGLAIVLVQNGAVVEGHVGTAVGALAFTVSVDAAGSVTLDQIRAVVHPNTSDPNDNVTLSADNLVTLTATVTDKDGDHSSATLNIGQNLNFHDDGPALGTVQNQQTDNNPATTPAVGTLHFTPGADGAGTNMTITANVTGLLSGGHALVTHQVGNVLTAYQDVGPAGFDAGDTTVVFTITVNPNAGTSGQYVFDLVTPLDPTVTDVPIGGSSAFGAGPTGFQVLDSATAQHLSVLSGYHTTASFNEATWLSTGSLTSAMITDAGVNGSTNGWGVDNNNFNGTDELMFFDFGSQALSDPDGAGGIDPGSSGAAPLPDISIATYKLIGYTAADDISYVVHYTDGTIDSGHIPSANMAGGNWVFTADSGKFIGDIQLFTSGTGSGKIDLVSVGVQSTSLDKSIAASVTLTDGDGDPTGTGAFTIHVATGLVPFAPVAPVVLDLNGDGVHFLDAAAGVTYDYGHGAVATAWASPQDGILVNDANHNGTVDNASEFVFGSGSVTDLQALAAFDTNHDGQLSSADANFANFAVWQDANSNGVADAGEVQTLTARGITSISLTTDGIAYAAAGGDVQVAGNGTYTRTDGSVRSLADAAFQTGANSGANAALLGAIAAAGLAVDASATAASHASVTAGLMATTAAAAHSQAFTPESLGSVSESHTSDLLALHNDAHDAAQGQNASARAADVANSNASLDSAKASADHGPTELLAGTQAPAHDQAGSNGGAAMPAAAQIAGFAAGGNAQHAQVVGQILADALHGGANGATIDHVLSALPGNGGGADAALAALASHGAEAVPNGDSNVFANFTMGHAAFTMEAMMVHVDAAPTHA